MAFGGMKITTAGNTMLAQALTGGVVTFTKMEIGDGSKTTGFESTTELVHFLYALSIGYVLRNGLKVTVTSEIANSGITEGYDLREIGLYAKLDEGAEILFAYDNAGEDAISIPPGTDNVSMDGRIRFAFQVSEEANVTISTGGLLYADYDHTHDAATQEAAGFMSAADKLKLDQQLSQAVNADSTPTFAGANLTNDLNMNGKVIHNAKYEA